MVCNTTKFRRAEKAADRSRRGINPVISFRMDYHVEQDLQHWHNLKSAFSAGHREGTPYPKAAASSNERAVLDQLAPYDVLIGRDILREGRMYIDWGTGHFRLYFQDRTAYERALLRFICRFEREEYPAFSRGMPLPSSGEKHPIHIRLAALAIGLRARRAPFSPRPALPNHIRPRQ